MGTKEVISYHPINSRCPGEAWRDEDIVENYAVCGFDSTSDILNEHLDKNDRILDAGCGYGRHVNYLDSLGYNITGIELSQEAVDLAKKQGLRVQAGDINSLPYKDESFDSILCLGVVEHLESGVSRPLSEFRRLLSDNGRLFISIPTQNIVRYLVTNPLKTIYRYIRILGGVRFRFEEYRYSRRKFRGFLIKAGFDVIEEIPNELIPPQNIGLWVDFPFLRGCGAWELNRAGKIIRRFLDFISPWLANGSTLWICSRKSC